MADAAVTLPAAKGVLDPVTTIKPKGERLRQAVRWIAEQRNEDSSRNVALLIQQASFRLNLTPKEELFLVSFYQQDDHDQQDSR